MNNFRILAIKTGLNGISPRNFLKSTKLGVDVNYLKNLNPNTVYSFYNNYFYPNNNFTKINYEPEKNIQLYSIKLSDNRVIPLNINAIVGENGSGKSTLIELIYWMNYNIGCKFDLLTTWDNEKYLINEELDLELFYQVSDDLYFILKFHKGNIDKLEVKFDKNHSFDLVHKPSWNQVNKITDIPDFFYSIVVNYSQYALNSLEVGEWINPLFHKNDGYQTPIVLNPMRDEGNIDINREKLLLARRLQSNVLEKIAPNTDLVNTLRNLSNGKIASTLRVTFNEKYLIEAEKKYGLIEQQDLQNTMQGIEKYFKFKPVKKNIEYDNYVGYMSQYIYYKLKKLVHKYPTYIEHREGSSIKDISNLLAKIEGSDSHISFKVKGAILHLKYFNEIYKHSKFNFDDSFDIEIAYLSDVIHSRIKENFLVNTFMMSMPSFFNVEIIPDNDLSMSNFSSGEKQKIFSLSSIIYHLINLNSVEKLTTNFINYKYINIILDEIEMYYHPEWQRKYISDLIEYTSKINPESLKQIEGINLTFLTHSPFILSDIPTLNLLMLKVKNNISLPDYSKDQTFGSNIHDLLIDNFFMTSTIGEYSKEKINEFVTILNKTIKNRIENKPRALKASRIKLKNSGGRKFIELIGDSLVKDKLLQLYFLATEDSDNNAMKKYYEMKLDKLNN